MSRAVARRLWPHGPTGGAGGSVALDVRPGGAWQATMVSPDGGEYPMSGTHREVEANRRLVIAMDTPPCAAADCRLRLSADRRFQLGLGHG
jgi:uncharacterized protein YndB with AHSA1/START domain